ncbi:DUF1819 family protein [Pseudomonas songnenensis]|jgi:hypothetical protein|uniref:DUF1819 family protein n=1 Tax=Pseudomonas songnenensis TaxID=1176259 RepID=A0A482UCX7_9PSED|nr:DUF1819 family protein [Pseudomonas songnenensis]RYJ60912.1 DUF1819 family protein [Pseudomonas songnenensis]|tara:strand:+ start:122 stop:736 length:615 start_codon:yes stop_codon:yes gene_type:complete
MSPERYRLSFTTGGLFLLEAPLVAERFLMLRDWSQTRTEVRSGNLLQARTASAAKRISIELFGRLGLLNIEELELLVEGNLRERGYLLWSAVCRRYAFIRDFAIEVLREYYLNRRHQIMPADYEAFYNAKALWHTELDEIAASTQKRLRHGLFQMLREADLLSEQGQIQPALLTPHLARLIAMHGREHLLVFTATDSEIQRWLQ